MASEVLRFAENESILPRFRRVEAGEVTVDHVQLE